MEQFSPELQQTTRPFGQVVQVCPAGQQRGLPPQMEQLSPARQHVVLPSEQVAQAWPGAQQTVPPTHTRGLGQQAPLIQVCPGAQQIPPAHT
jgi:hypothetical protein